MSTVMTRTGHPFDDVYANAVGALPGATEAWVDGLRKTARALLDSQGLPTRKSEAWKYTNLGALGSTAFIPAAQADDVDVDALPVSVPVLDGAVRVVCVNGAYRPDLSDPLDDLGAGVHAEALASSFNTDPAGLKPVVGAVAQAAKSWTVALNTAFMADGLRVSVSKQAELTRPLHIVSIGASGAEPGVFHPRVVIDLAAGSQATIVESHVGLPGQAYLSNAVTEALLAEDACLNHYTIVNDDSDASHLGHTAVTLGQNSDYESAVLMLGGALSRREVNIRLEEQHARARVDGMYAAAADRHNDIHTVVDHLAPSTVSSQTVKGVLGGKSRGVFQGRIHVAREAQQTDGRQIHKALLLDKGPAVDCKPELEIFADDVQCAHGATTGELDDQHIFYLMSRGIDADTARALLIEGFLDDVALEVRNEQVQRLMLDLVKVWLLRHVPRGESYTS